MFAGMNRKLPRWKMPGLAPEVKYSSLLVKQACQQQGYEQDQGCPEKDAQNRAVVFGGWFLPGVSRGFAVVSPVTRRRSSGQEQGKKQPYKQ